MEAIKNFFKSTWVWVGLSVAAVGAAAAYIFKVNDFTRPPVPDPAKPHDFGGQLAKLDPKTPMGILAFNHTYGEGIGTKLTINTARNSLIEKMREHYGDNVVVIDNPSELHFENFAKQFNGRFATSKPEVHFVGNHHARHSGQDIHNEQFAHFIESIDAGKKRALVLSCGPESKIYENAGCEYVIIPRPDKEVLGREFDFKISPAYREAIGWMRHCSDPEGIRKKFNENTFDNLLHGMRDRTLTVAKDIYFGEAIEAHKPPLVMVPGQAAGKPKAQAQRD